MTDSGSDDESVKKISVKFKTTTETFALTITENSTVTKVGLYIFSLFYFCIKVKKLVAKELNQLTEKICLIFSGKILKDHETLAQHSKFKIYYNVGVITLTICRII